MTDLKLDEVVKVVIAIHQVLFLMKVAQFSECICHITNEMDSPYLLGIAMCQSGIATTPLNDRRSPHEYYNDWYRFGED